jgi:hypothetical protein
VTLWGTTNGINDSGFWTGGQIFTVDTDTGAVSIKATYSSSTMIAFGDIAVRGTNDNPEIYVTYAVGFDHGFDKLAKVNPSTWAFDWVQDLGDNSNQVNALEFINGKLYGVTGGGIAANLLEFTLTGSGATVTNLGSLGINSDGDITRYPGNANKFFYSTWETGSTSELNVATFSPVGKTGKEISTSSGWAGLVYENGNLWGGSYWDQKLYTLDWNTGNATHTATLVYDLSTDLGGGITGLSMVPIPGALWLFGSGLLGLGLLGRRRKRG